MATIGCRDFLSHLESWMEGECPADAEAHLRGCAACRGFVEDMNAISATAGEWRGEQSEPGPHVWMSLRSQLEQEGLIRTEPAPVQASARKGFFAGMFPRLPRLALAGASLGVIAAIALAASGPIHRDINDRSWMRHTQNSTRPLDAELATVETHTVAAFTAQNPLVTASLHRDLAVVDNYIALCEKSVREEPENEMARDYLYGAYQQKAELLADMSEHGVDDQ